MSYGIGLMSGTSLDGIDVALVKIDNSNDKEIYQLVDFMTYDLTEGTKERIHQGMDLAMSNVALLCSLNIELGEVFAAAVEALLARHEIPQADLLFIASHGQTLYHQPNGNKALGYLPSTLQLGESSVIAERTQITVISDFRYRDMAVGGQGAPIVPFSEFLLYRSDTVYRVLQNIGGISNSTLIPAGASLADVSAFDCGPGNMIIDELCRHFYGCEYDKDGAFARRGQVNQALLDVFMSHPFMSLTGPRTTGREDFGAQYVADLLTQFDLSADDWLATATMFTAKAIASSLAFIPAGAEVIIGGGGSYNLTLLAMLAQEMPQAKVLTQEDLGFSSAAKEAVAMVVLGYQTYHGRPSNVPSATGAEKAVILGKITPV